MYNYNNISRFSLFLIFSFLGVLSAHSQTVVEKRKVTLSASGVVKVEPDMAHINTGVETTAKTAQEAVRKNSKAMADIIEVLKDFNVRKQHIQTTNFTVQPRYESYKISSSQNRSPKIIGYQVINSVSITIKDQKKLGDILDKVVSLGSNRINNIAFSVSKSEQFLDQARRKAMKTAIQRARLYTKAAGARLGKVLNISENSSYRPSRPIARSRSFSVQEASVPIQAGSQDLRVFVTVTWEIK